MSRYTILDPALLVRELRAKFPGLQLSNYDLLDYASLLNKVERYLGKPIPDENDLVLDLQRMVRDLNAIVLGTAKSGTVELTAEGALNVVVTLIEQCLAQLLATGTLGADATKVLTLQAVLAAAGLLNSVASTVAAVTGVDPATHDNTIVTSVSGTKATKISGNTPKGATGKNTLSSKSQFEFTVGALTNTMAVGIATSTVPTNVFPTGSAGNSVLYRSDGTIWKDGVQVQSGYPTYGNGDTVIGNFDADTGKVWFGKNGVIQGAPSAGTGQATTATAGSYKLSVFLYDVGDEVTIREVAADLATALQSGYSPAYVVYPSSRYWRIVMNSSGQGINVIAALDVREITNTNIISSATLGSNGTNASYPLSNLTDGNASTFWGDTNLTTPIITLDFATTKALRKMLITTRNDGFYIQSPSSYELQYLDTNGNWTAVVLGLSAFTSAGQTQTFDAAGLTGSQPVWQVRFTGSGGSQGSCAELILSETVGGSKVTGATLTASTTNTTYVPANADDSNASTFWATSASSGYHWLRATFSSGKAIVDVRWTPRNDGFHGESPGAGVVMKGSDGINWLPVLEFSGLSWSSGVTKTLMALQPDDRLTYTKVTAYAICGTPDDSLFMSKTTAYAVVTP